MTDGYGRSRDGFGLTREANVELLVRTALAEGVDDPRHIAYILATAQHETRDFQASEEDFGRAQARKLGYRGGEEYFGRGYVQLTHVDHYERFDRQLGLEGRLSQNPDLASTPDIAARIIVIGMRDGLFTGRKLGDYIGHDADYFNARRTVNGISERQSWSVEAAHSCVTHAMDWLDKVPAIVEKIEAERALSPPFEGQVSPPLNRPLSAFTRDSLGIDSLLDSRHPLHDGYAAIQRDVAAWEQRIGKDRDARTENLELSLLRLATESGISPEWVKPSIANEHVRAGQNVFVGQGDPNAHPRRYVHMDTQAAIETPAVESLREIEVARSRTAIPPIAVNMQQDDPQQRVSPRI